MMVVMQAILAVFILVGGFIKLFRVPFQVEHWQHYQHPLWFMSIIGFIDIIGAIGIIGDIWNQYLALDRCNSETKPEWKIFCIHRS